MDPEHLVCGNCTRTLNDSPVLTEEPPEGVDRIVSCADHSGVARELLGAYKFRRLIALGPLIGGYMADAASSCAPEALLIPVPAARLRTWFRGFDPVGHLASIVAPPLGLRVPSPPVLIRRGSGRQRGRSRQGRMGDPPDIRLRSEGERIIGGRSVVLLDDVMTTGATLMAAAFALRQGGAGSVFALTFTRRL